PQYVGPDNARRVAYRSNAGTVEVYANVYGEQRQGKELVSYDNTLLAPGAWERDWPQVTRTLPTKVPQLASFEARADDGSRWLIAYVFKVGAGRVRSEPSAQLAYGALSFLRPTPAGVIALATRCNENCEAARALVTSFWDDM